MTKSVYSAPCNSRRRRRWAWACALAGVMAATLYGQPAAALDPSRALTQTIHRIWQTQQGLPQGTIYCIYQTRDRYLWLGTKSGLVRFDGAEFTVVREAGDVSLEDIWVRQIAEDDQGTLWIATDGDGLIRWNGQEAVRLTMEDGLPSNNVLCVQIDPDNNVWIGTENGLAKFAYAEDEIESDDFAAEAGPIRAICLSSDSKLWIASGARVCVQEGKSFSAIPLEQLSDTVIVTALAPGENGSVWAGTSQGLVHIAGDVQRLYTTRDGLSNDHVFCLTTGGADSLWIGTGDGFNRLRDGKFEHFRAIDGLSQSSAYAICEDHEGSLWVGTKLGLNQFVDRRTIPFTTSEGLPSDNTGPIEQDRSGAIWVGTLDAGLARWDGKRFTKLGTGDGLPSNAIYALTAANDGSLWVGTDKGLCRVKDKKVAETLTTETGLPTNRIHALYCDSQDDVWVGTASGLVVVRDGKVISESTPKELHGPIVAIVGAGDSKLIASTTDGELWKRVAGTWSPVDKHGARPSQITSLFFDDDTLFATTAGNGLYLFQPERTVHLSLREGLYDDQLFGVTADKLGRFWIACSKGVFSFQKQDLQAYLEGKAASIPTAPLSPLDALRTVECQQDVQPAVKLMNDGRLWFSTVRGVLVIDPSHWQRVLPPTSVVVDKVIINGKSEDPQQILDIPPGNANLTFHYAALSYTSPTRITFRYRLEGFDKEWIDAGTRREAFYTNIPPGDYRFVVAAMNADGKLYTTDAPVQLTISPHWYQASWFLPMVGIALASAVWIAYRLRVRSIRQKMNAIVIERSRIARELHDGLMQGFSGITMEMQALSSRLPDESSERQSLDEIIADAGHCLREARRSIAGLRGTQSSLAVAIQQAAQQLAQTHDMRLKLRLAPMSRQLPPETEYNLLRIAQEALANALAHSGGSTVEVILEHPSDELRLIVTDDGQGFTEVDGPPYLGHYGLIGMRERARQIGATLEIRSRPGQGTTIEVVLPMSSPLASEVAR